MARHRTEGRAPNRAGNEQNRRALRGVGKPSTSDAEAKTSGAAGKALIRNAEAKLWYAKLGRGNSMTGNGCELLSPEERERCLEMWSCGSANQSTANPGGCIASQG